MHKQQGWPQAWEYCQAKPIQKLGRASQEVTWNWSQCIKSQHTQTSSGKGLPSYFWNRNIVRRRKKTILLLSGPKSSFQIKVNFAFNLEIKVPKSGGRVERHKIQAAWSQGWFGVPWRLLVSIVVYQVQSKCSGIPGDFGALYASICWEALWGCWFPFPAGLKHLPTLPTPLPSEGSIVLQQCHRLIASIPHFTDAGVCDKGALTNYWVHKWTYFKELELFCFAKSFFFDWSGNILIFWYTGFLTKSSK